MEKIVPWQRLLCAIEPHYPKGTRGRPPIGLERMRRINFLQQWYGLSDEGLEDALYDSIALRGFAGIDLAVENVPDATTLLKFRRLLIEHELTRKLFDEIGISLCERGLMMKEGTLVDATIIEAPVKLQHAGCCGYADATISLLHAVPPGPIRLASATLASAAWICAG